MSLRLTSQLDLGNERLLNPFPLFGLHVLHINPTARAVYKNADFTRAMCCREPLVYVTEPL